jgi:hypothetical protein
VGIVFVFLLQARLWACGQGDMSTPSFGSHLNPILTREADYAHPIYWCPHQVLKATGAPVLPFVKIEILVARFIWNEMLFAQFGSKLPKSTDLGLIVPIQ